MGRMRVCGGRKSEGSMSEGSESESDISSMRAWRDILAFRETKLKQERGSGSFETL